jgi:hypothetical protein
MELSLVFDKKLLKRNNVPVRQFAKFASEFQETLYDLGASQKPNVKRRVFNLLIQRQAKGSQAFILIPQLQTATFGTSPIDEVVQTFSEISNAIERDRDGSNYERVKSYFNSPKMRIKVFNRLRRISRYPGSFTIELKKSPDTVPKRIFRARKRYKSTLKKWKELEVQKRVETITGALTIIHGERDLYIRIRDKFGHSVEYKYDEREEERFHGMYKKIIRAEGLYNPISNEMEEIKQIEVLSELTLNDLKGLEFKTPLTLSLDYHYDAFFCRNTDLNIVAAGETFTEMYNNLYDCIITHLHYFMDKDQNLTKGAQKIKKGLLDLISEKDLEELTNGYN